MTNNPYRGIYQRHPWLLKPAAAFFTLIFPLVLILKWVIDAHDEGVFDGSASELWGEIKGAWIWKEDDA